MPFDREDPYYKACMTASVAGGTASGIIVTAPTTPIGQVVGAGYGAVFGFAVGYKACPYLTPYLRKWFEKEGVPLDEFVLNDAVTAMQKYANVHDPHDALKLVSLVVNTPTQASQGAQACTQPAMVSEMLLSEMKSEDADAQT